MTYSAPIDDILFVLEDLCDLDGVAKLPGLEETTQDMVAAILEEAAKFADQILAPLNPVGDTQGATCEDGTVSLPAGWHEAYSQLIEMGWNSPAATVDHGGMGLPAVVTTSIQEIFYGANTAFTLCTLLTQGAIEAIEGYASDALKEAYLPKLVTGEWSGTMNLTEPQAGSDLAAIRTKAVAEDDHYLVSGQKIFITYGDHDMSENIVHLVLARLPDAPEGVKGISLFLVPKFLVMDDGSIGAANDLRCVSIEHKLGIHGSPTCTMAFGDNGGAVGYLIGKPHEGLKYMFAMMNNARLGVGLQGVGIGEHATQHAIRYALERKQGQTPQGCQADTIIGHPDVRRMLGLMKSRTEAARVIAYRAARALDDAKRAEDAGMRARSQRRVDLLIPIAKGWSTELAVETASLGVQVHGGMGYIEETGAAQFLRDARITTIYEGTTGIQALDLVGRKIMRDKGVAAKELVADIRASAAALYAMDGDAMDWAGMGAAVEQAANLIENTTDWLLLQKDQVPSAVAVDTLHLFGVALGAWTMGDAALKAAQRIIRGDGAARLHAKLNMARFYMDYVLPEGLTLEKRIRTASAAISGLEIHDFADHIE